MKAIIAAAELCGCQGIALRGHRDDVNYDGGNHQALLKFRCDAGDTVLAEHFMKCARHSTTTQYMMPLTFSMV